MSRFICASLLSLVTFNTYALDCERPIKQLYVGDDGRDQIYIVHGDSYGISRMQPDYVSNNTKIMDKTLSVILTAKISGKSIVFRYSEAEDGSAPSCTPSSGQKLTGVWVKF